MNDAPPVPDHSLRWLAVMLAPFVTMSAYLLFSRWPVRWFTAASDYAGLAVSFIVFTVSLLTVPAPWKFKVFVLACGTALLPPVLIYFSFLFVGVLFGDWL